jgi:hypothetical protein
MYAATVFIAVTLVTGNAFFPGEWGGLGQLFFLVWVVTMYFGVVRPLAPWVARARTARSRTLVWSVLLVGSLLLWMFGAAAIQPVSAGVVNPSVTVLPILSAFGPVPTAEYALGPIQGQFNIEQFLTFLLLSYLWAGLAIVEWDAFERRRACAPEEAGVQETKVSPAPTLLSWLPLLGISTGCCSPPVLELLLVGVLPASGPYFTSFRDLNWMWDGLLEVLSAVILVYLVARLTEREAPLGDGTSAPPEEVTEAPPIEKEVADVSVNPTEPVSRSGKDAEGNQRGAGPSQRVVSTV